MTRKLRFAMGGLSVIALGLAACSTQRAGPAPGPVASGPRALSPADYVAATSSIDLFVVRAAALAATRSDSARVRLMASEMAEAHRGLAAQLSIAGRRVNTLPSATLQQREAERLASLEARYSDADFVRQLRGAHDQALAIHAAFAVRGSSATLRPVAANAARVERGHLAELASR